MVLAHLGVRGEPYCRPYYGNLTAWGGPPALSLFGRRGQGWHLDRSRFDTWLRDEAVARGAVLTCPARLVALAAVADGWKVSLDGHESIAARWLVDAGGRRAPVARRLGAKRQRFDALVALAVRVPCSAAGLAGYTLVEAVADGWWYACEIPGGDAVVMLMTDSDIAMRYRSADAFAEAWQRAGELARRIVPPAGFAARPRAFAAHGATTLPACGERWIAVGDALMAFDPLTSSGLSGALNDGIAAAGLISAALRGERQGEAYRARAYRTLSRYLAEHAAYYALETRWPESPFWQRRKARRLGTESLAVVRV